MSLDRFKLSSIPGLGIWLLLVAASLAWVISASVRAMNAISSNLVCRF